MRKTRSLKLAEKAARMAGDILIERFQKDAGIIKDQGRDIKTLADQNAEAEILKILRPTGTPILTEEAGADADALWESELWVVDPLDGTFNYVRRIKTCCVSIGFWAGGQPVLGVIYDFLNDDMYAGEIGQGVTLNGHPMKVSRISELDKAALVTGFPSARNYGENSLTRFVTQVQRYKKIRMLGSAAMSLAHVATGRVEAYQEESIWFWDVAAGLVLVKAGGGDFEISTPNDDWKMNVYAHNGIIGNLNG